MRGLQRLWGKVSSHSSRTASKSNSLAFPGCGEESIEAQMLLAAIL